MVAKFKTMEPMRYYDRAADGLSANLLGKRNAILNNTHNAYIATRKYDGEWAMFIRGEGDDISIRSRNISKITGTYGDMTEKLPHLVREMAEWPPNTVALGEVCWPNRSSVSTDVGTIMRCLPEKAVYRQEAGNWLSAVLFDILMLNGVEVMGKGYAERLELILGLFPDYTFDPTLYFHTPTVYTTAFREAADAVIAEGGEGIVIQERNYSYEPGKRAAWRTLKIKETLSSDELKVVGAVPANRAYSGDNPGSWLYWETLTGEKYQNRGRKNELDVPVSKPYFYGWMMGIECDYKGVSVIASSGLTDADREWLATSEATTAIANGELYAEISGMQETADGKVRHPVVRRLRLMDVAMTKERINEQS